MCTFIIVWSWRIHLANRLEKKTRNVPACCNFIFTCDVADSVCLKRCVSVYVTGCFNHNYDVDQVTQEHLERSFAASRAQIEQLTRDNQTLRFDLSKLREEYHAKCEELRRRAEVSLSEYRVINYLLSIPFSVGRLRWRNSSSCRGKCLGSKNLTSLGGLEPPTFRLTAERANRLRHRDSWYGVQVCSVFMHPRAMLFYGKNFPGICFPWWCPRQLWE